MSCKDCEDAQNGNMSAYYRWGTANIELRGCRIHLKEIIDFLNTKVKDEQ